MHLCQNCGHAYEGEFCNNCGQKVVHRITGSHVLHELIHVFTHADKGIFLLIKALALRPGLVVREYLQGKRKKYFNPFQFLLLMTAFSTFLTVTFHLTSGNSQASTATVFTEKYFNILMLLHVPLSALFFYLFFKKTGYNFWEHVVLNSFLGGERSILFLFYSIFLVAFRDHYSLVLSVYTALWMIYLVVGYVQFFKDKSPKYLVIKTIAATLLGYVFHFILIVAIIFLYLYWSGGLHKVPSH